MAVEVVNFHDVKQHWNKETQTWDDPKFFYIGRKNRTWNLPASVFQNPYPIVNGDRNGAIKAYASFLTLRPHLVEQAKWQLTDKVLVCWCRNKPRRSGEPTCCHGDLLKEIVDA